MSFRVAETAERRSCIVVEEDEDHVLYIPFDGLKLDVVRSARSEFYELYEDLDYPVGQAAKRYLKLGQTLGILTPEASKQLFHIIDRKVSSIMNEDVGINETKRTRKPKVVPNSKAAPNGKITKEKPAPVKEEIPAKKRSAPAKGKSEDSEVRSFTIGDDSSVKRGFVKEYVDAAREMGEFTRDDLVQEFKRKEEESRLIRYFTYCVQHGIFVEK